jgi:CRP/FNR family transcriptional regulator, anaerobic regulatory protein
MSNIEFSFSNEIHEQQTEDHTETFTRYRQERDRSDEMDQLPWDGPRVLAARDLLFSEGEARTHSAFKLESGAICCVRRFAGERCEVIEFAVAGDIVGFGPLDTYMWNAEAVVETRLRALTEGETLDIEAVPEKARLRLRGLANREFTTLRDNTVEAGCGAAALGRVSAMVLALAVINAREGRDPLVIGDDLGCGMIADALGYSVEELSTHLVELSRRGLITAGSAHELRLTDLAALEQLIQSGA